MDVQLGSSTQGLWLSGRASALHAEGPGFDPRHLQFFSCLQPISIIVLCEDHFQLHCVEDFRRICFALAVKNMSPVIHG